MAQEQGGRRSAGKRAGARPKRPDRGRLLLLALGVTGALVAWGYLVLAAIDFGTTARSGDEQSWWFVALAALGAVACLFLALILLSRISRALGLTDAPVPTTSDGTVATEGTSPSGPPRPSPPGGRRAAR